MCATKKKKRKKEGEQGDNGGVTARCECGW